MPFWKPETFEDVFRRIRNGDGSGEGPRFKSFITVRFPSKGRCYAFRSMFFDRIDHCVSLLEFKHVVVMSAAPGMTDVCTQIALLPYEEPQEIAREKGIRFPTYPGTNIPIVMTSDIAASLERSAARRRFVVSVKYSVDVEEYPREGDQVARSTVRMKRIRRTLDLLRIEREYWRRRGIPWYLCTERTLPEYRFRNLEFFHGAMLRRDCDYLNPMIPEFCEIIAEQWNNSPLSSFNSLLKRSAIILRVPVNHAFVLFGRSLWTHRLAVDLDCQLIHHACPILLLEAGSILKAAA